MGMVNRDKNTKFNITQIVVRSWM